MRVQCQILSEDERQKIHEESIKILEQVGAKFLSKRALKILNDNGATIDQDTGIAKIPAEMVEQALKTAPKSFALGSRDPSRDVVLPRPTAGYVLDMGGVFTRDFHTGERRYATLQDNADCMRVFDESPLAFPARSGRIRRAARGALHYRSNGGDPGQRGRHPGAKALFGSLLHAGAAGARR